MSNSELSNSEFGFEDEYGIIAPAPLEMGVRKIAPEDFPSGPAVGARLPDFALCDQLDRRVQPHQDRGQSKAAVVFFRSAVW